jgi:UDP-N-acetylglucosamine--N-acetylmuramyl-(pentapeptide) pyrophosphoryl-undecaprenol N-acetylglucosamine transferase
LTWAVIAGGGTAGHVVPALAIGRALVERGHAAESILFVGSKRGIDSKLVPPAGFPLVVLPGRGLTKKPSLENLRSVLALLRGLLQAVVLVARHRPAVVVSMGGYAAAPCALAAAFLRIPLVLSEQNAVPTRVHRLLSRFATASAVPFEGTPLPKPVVTGNPVRTEILAVDRSEAGKRAAREALGLPLDRVVVAAMGGSLGARRINEAVFGLARAWADRSDVAIRHAVGERDWSTVPTDLGDGALVYQPVRYEERMDLLMAAADVAVSRAGGATVAELAVVGLPAILVPLPIAPFDHQAANAEALVRTGGAVMVRDHELDTERVVAELERFMAEPGGLTAVGERLKAVARPDAADAVAAVVEQHARRG